MNCTTHHTACDCREERTRRIIKRLLDHLKWSHSYDDQECYDEMLDEAIELGYLKKGEI